MIDRSTARLLFLLAVSLSCRRTLSFVIDHAQSARTVGSHAIAASQQQNDSLQQHAQIQEHIEESIRTNSDPGALISQLEAMQSTKEPNRQEAFRGQWHVWYTDCPPPSNGVLGPFQGTSSQFIGHDGGYQNFLKVAPNDWLAATLDGIWEDWDGVVIVDKGETKPDPSLLTAPDASRDWGADHWKVTFKQLQIKLFGIALFTKQFDANTSRVWRTTFLNDDVRIVRAGKTGRLEDEVVFYTKRSPAPRLYKY